jgi:uncharacterized protein (TIGR02147 family)
MQDIFKFTDFRKYLQYYYNKKKRLNHTFSYQSFAQKAGLNRSFLYNIINSSGKQKKNLSKTNINKIVNALKLDHTSDELEFFRNIVAYTQTPEDKIEDRLLFLNKAQQIIVNNKIRLIRKDESEYFAKWYHSVICSLIEMYPVKDDYEQLCSLLLPLVTPSQAKKTVQLLSRLGLITADKNGYFQRNQEKIIKTGKDIPQEIKDHIHAEYAALAIKAIRDIAPQSRYIISNTLGVSQETYGELIKEIETFRNAIRRLVDSDKKPNRIYQLEIMLFPLSIDGSQTGEQ